MKQSIGELGEEITCRYLEERGFHVKDRNYRKKWGEIDVIVEKQGVIHVVEVKSVSCENIELMVSRENNLFSPENMVTPKKIHRMRRVIGSYFLEKGISHETDWVFDIAAVFVDRERRVGRVRFHENMVI